ncbi:hypothetical protein HY947_04935 [Candidatus Gottesmanbacteria bacterium]|nr:hypothetical protein [Candidatus Gottesmanbacteria bacterium]
MADPNERTKLLSFSLAALPGFAIGLVLFLLFRAENTYPIFKAESQGCLFSQCFDAFAISMNLEAFFFYLIFSLSGISVLIMKSKTNQHQGKQSPNRKLLIGILIVLLATIIVDLATYQLSTRHPQIFTKMASITRSYIPCYAMWSGGFWWESKAACFFTYGVQRQGYQEACKRWNFEEYVVARINCQADG